MNEVLHHVLNDHVEHVVDAVVVGDHDAALDHLGVVEVIGAFQVDDLL